MILSHKATKFNAKECVFGQKTCIVQLMNKIRQVFKNVAWFNKSKKTGILHKTISSFILFGLYINILKDYQLLRRN